MLSESHLRETRYSGVLRVIQLISVSINGILNIMRKEYHGYAETAGVYKITNGINGKIYIGQTKHFKRRAEIHEKALNSQKHPNRHLQAAWNSYGSTVFVFEVLSIIQNKEERDKAEQQLIDQNFGTDCYNQLKYVIPQPGKQFKTPRKRRSLEERRKNRKPRRSISPKS